MAAKLHTLGETLFRQILEIIYAGELPPGAELNEAALAERFGVSRGPVREAMRRLQGIGIVSREPYFRARVVHLDTAGVVELFQMREALEGMACRLAAQHMPQADIASLAADLERSRKSVLTGEGASGDSDSDRAFDFHERVVRGANNSRITQALCGDLYQLLRLYRRASGADLSRKEDAYREHWQILQAIKGGDADLAESLMRSHVGRATRNLVEHMKADPAPAESPAGAQAAMS